MRINRIEFYRALILCMKTRIRIKRTLTLHFSVIIFLATSFLSLRNKQKTYIWLRILDLCHTHKRE